MGMNQNKIILSMAILAILVSIPSIDALESNTEYFIESDNIVVIISVDFQDKVSLVDGWVTVDEEIQMFDMNNIKTTRISDANERGRFLGTTETGSVFYVIYDLTNEPQLLIKVWSDQSKTRLVESATITDL